MAAPPPAAEKGEVVSKKVARLGASNNLKNIPHMLRNLADEIESGVTPSPETAFVIAVYSQYELPDVYQFGQEIGRLAEVGALTAAIHLTMQTEQVP